MDAQPKRKVDELEDELELLVDERVPPEFRLARVARGAQSLLQKGITPDAAHALLGIVDALAGNSDGFIEHFRIAKQLSPNRRTRGQFAIFAMRLGLHRVAAEQAIELFRTYPDDVQVLKLAREVASHSLHFELFFAARTALHKLGIPDDELTAYCVPRFERTMQLCRSMDVGWDPLVTRADAAGTVLREFREPIFDVMYDTGTEGQLSHAFAVKADIDTITNINFAIVDRLVEQFDDTFAEVVTFCCLPARRELFARRVPKPSEATQR